jgi:hypothetical protein
MYCYRFVVCGSVTKYKTPLCIKCNLCSLKQVSPVRLCVYLTLILGFENYHMFQLAVAKQ